LYRIARVIKCLQLLKYEFTYHKLRLVVALCLPTLYLIISEVYVSFQFDKHLYARVLFPLIFGMIPIVLIAVTWVISIKELRLRKLKILPLPTYKIFIGRLLTAIVPLTFLISFGLSFMPYMYSEWAPITDRIIYQYGTTALLVSTLYIVYEVINTVSYSTDISKIITGVPFFVVCITFVFLTDDALWTKILQSYIGVLYFTVSIILMLLGTFIATKRKFFLV
jgi:hypothetical protein